MNDLVDLDIKEDIFLFCIIINLPYKNILKLSEKNKKTLELSHELPALLIHKDLLPHRNYLKV